MKHFKLILIISVIYCTIYALNTGFMVNNTQFYCLHDDIMISMRYAGNLANGYGLVWNPGGERVEGFTNFGWTLFLTLFHYLKIPINEICFYVQLFAVLFLTLNLIYIKKIICLFTDNPHTQYMTVICTAFYLPLISWSIQGFEVSIITLLISMAVFYVLKGEK